MTVPASAYPEIFSNIQNRPESAIFNPSVYTDWLSRYAGYVSEFDMDEVEKVCAAQADDGKKPFILVSCDLSGIQESVYTISSKGSLKSLRARSFALELLCEHICYELLNKRLGDFGKYRHHIVFSGGGNLALVLPNNVGTITAIEGLKKELGKWTLSEFSGKLFVAMAWLPAERDELLQTETFRDGIWQEMVKLLEHDKRLRFKDYLSNVFTSDAVKQGEPVQRTPREECQICHRDNVKISPKEPFYTISSNFERIENVERLSVLAGENDVVHELCYHLFRLGDKLIDADRIVRVENKPERSESGHLWFPDVNGDPVYYRVIKTVGNRESSGVKHIWSINKIEQGESPFFFGSYVRKVASLPGAARSMEYDEGAQDEHTASLLGLAHAACGAELIGCLRMDVDNLGKVLFEGSSKFNINTLAQLSRHLNLFFKVFLNGICGLGGDVGQTYTNVTQKDYSNQQGRNVSIVYSGGDDLFIVGAWHEVAELSFDIQHAFAQYSGLGISAAVTLHKPDFPFYQMAKLSEEALNAAKSYTKEGELQPSKNRLALFYSPFDKHKSETLNKTAREDEQAGKQNYSDKLIYALEWSNPTVFELMGVLVALTEPEEGRLRLRGVSHGLIHRLFDLLGVWWSRNSMYVPEFVYTLTQAERHMAFDKFEQLRNIVILAPSSRTVEKHDAIRMLKIPLTWFELLQRRKGGQNES